MQNNENVTNFNTWSANSQTRKKKSVLNQTVSKVLLQHLRKLKLQIFAFITFRLLLLFFCRKNYFFSNTMFDLTKQAKNCNKNLLFGRGEKLEAIFVLINQVSIPVKVKYVSIKLFWH